MLIGEILHLGTAIAVSHIRTAWQIMRWENELRAKKINLNEEFREIGALAQYLKDGSVQFQQLRNQVERTETAFARMKTQMSADQTKRKALQLEIKRRQRGVFDSTPQIVNLRRQLRSLGLSDRTGWQRRSLKNELDALRIGLGRQAVTENVSPGMLGIRYREARGQVAQVNRLEQAIQELQDAGKAQRWEMRTAIFGKIAAARKRIIKAGARLRKF